eukprot:CAMPEP_0174888434 /NCGR_PEP_ID=MMETSP0167-20121228/3726_1 /TAXON_ID=38298 /ORGANISM="Rhodella maculata, Strain CCMP736" /LENGTH=37 /DNA_ID= /DNA_START= /DNA_END= /DNA_ORIENTATION=
MTHGEGFLLQRPPDLDDKGCEVDAHDLNMRAVFLDLG